MSEGLDFGAKSVLRAHLLKKEYISAPFNFKHVAHVGLKPDDETRSVTNYRIHNNNQGNIVTNDCQIRGNILENDQQCENDNQATLTNPKKKVYSQTCTKVPLSKEDISDPFDFVHIAHIGVDDIFGHEEMMRSETIRKIMKDAGVTQEQLEDAETRKFILNFLKLRRKSILAERKNKEQLKHSKAGFSKNLQANTSIHKEQRQNLTRHLSMNEYNYVGGKPIPPKKPPRLPLQKTKSTSLENLK